MVMMRLLNMTKDDLKWLVGIAVGLCLGGSITYTSIISNDATMNLKVQHIEKCQEQLQKEVNILKVQANNVSNKIQNSDDMLGTVSILVKENTKVNQNLTIVIARLEERLRQLEREK
jgi:hypothetical protein